jgi:putative two-component system response regulator
VSTTELVRSGTDARILIVDDEVAIRRSLSRHLEREGYTCTTAADAAEARERLNADPYELMLCDVTMPGESGFSLLAYTHEAHPDTAVIMVTAVDSPHSAKPAAANGAYGYIIKPFDTNTILINVAGALRRRSDKVADKALVERLEHDVATRSAELNDALTRITLEDRALSASQQETVLRLAIAAEWRDPDTGSHLKRMSDYSARLARRAGEPTDYVEKLRIASQMHDIGKIGLPDSVLLKPGPLSVEERIIMQRHAEIGYEMLADSASPLIQLAAIVALTHHERYDGSGYPRRLTGTDIPLEGRIIAIADVYDALRSARPYKKAFTLRDSLAILRDSRGTHFDPELLDLFLSDIEQDPDEQDPR